MRPALFTLALLTAASTPAWGADTCEIALRSQSGHDISIKYQVVGQPSHTGAFKVEDFVVSVFGVPAQETVRMELVDVHAPELTHLNQTLTLNLQSPYVTGTTAHAIDGRLYTSAANHQEMSIKVGESYLIDPINGTRRFQFSFAEHLGDGACSK